MTKKKQKEKIVPVRINFLKKKKTAYDNFIDVTNKYKAHAFSINKHGESNFSVAKFRNILKKKLKISSTKKLKRLFAGHFTKADEKKFKKLSKEFPNTKIESKQFSKHNFTFSHFPKRDIGKIKKYEQYYYKCGVRVVCRSKGTKLFEKFEGKLVEVWIIPNIPISHYSFKGYPKGYREFYDKINYRIHELPSILFFSFNYFSVDILDMRK